MNNVVRRADLLKGTVGQHVTVDLRRSLVISYMGLGDAYTTLAANNNITVNTEDWSAAHDYYQRALDIFQDLRRAGAIDAEEIAEIDKLAAKVAECAKKPPTRGRQSANS